MCRMSFQVCSCLLCAAGWRAKALRVTHVTPHTTTRHPSHFLRAFSSDPWPLPCLAVNESTTTCLNGGDTLPMRQADLHFVSQLDAAAVMRCLHTFARGEQRFGI